MQPVSFTVIYVILSYAFFTIVPGSLMYGLFFQLKNHEETPIFITYFFMANALGFSSYILLGWLLILIGHFYFLYLIFENSILIVGVLILKWSHSKRSKAEYGSVSGFMAIASILTLPKRATKKEIYAILISLMSSVLIFLPVILHVVQGEIIAGDSGTFSRISSLFVAVHGWPDLSTYIHAYYTSSSSPPGVSILYTMFSIPMAVNAVYATLILDPLFLFFILLGIVVIAKEYTNDAVIAIILGLFWVFGTFFLTIPSLSNLTVLFVPSGTVPDLVLSTIFFIALLHVVIAEEPDSMICPKAAVTGLLLSSLTLSNPLALLLSLPAYIIYLAYVYFSNGFSVYLRYLFIPVAILYVSFIPFLTTLKGIQGIRYGSGIINEYSIGFGLIAVSLIFSGVLFFIRKLMKSKLTLNGIKYIGRREVYKIALPLLSLLIGLVMYYSHLDEHLLGIGSFQVSVFNAVFLVLLIAIAYNFIMGLKYYRNKLMSTKATVVIVLFILIIPGIISYAGSKQIAQINNGQFTFDAKELEAANWMNANVHGNGTVLLDGNPGNTYSLVPFRNFLSFSEVIIPQYVFHNAIYLNPHPYNLPYIYANLLISWPNYTNALNAYKVVGYKYFIFEQPYNQKEINLYARLPYMEKLYNNSQVYIFEFVPEPKAFSYLVNPTEYTNSTSNVISEHWVAPRSHRYSGPLRLTFGVDNGPTILTATMENKSFASVTYRISSNIAANASISVHSFIFHPLNQTLSLSVNENPGVDLTYIGGNWNFTKSASIKLNQGSNTITLEMGSNLNDGLVYFNPIDYILISENS